MTPLPANWKRLTKSEIEKRLRASKSLLTAESKRSFGKGNMNMMKDRFESDSRTWALQYRFGDDTASRGHVEIVKLSKGGRS